MTLQDRVALVTGGGSSLGLAIARRFATEGASVVIADLAGAAAAAKGIAAEGHPALGLETDVASEASVAAAMTATLERYGRLDILVNNAAISSELDPTPFEQLSIEEWRRVLDVNLLGLFLCCRAAAPIMRRQSYGRIINLASTVAIKGVPMMSHYVASKGAVISLTRSLAHELGADGITVNAVAPGYILTEGNLRNPDMVAAQRARAVAGRALPRDGYAEDVVGSIASWPATTPASSRDRFWRWMAALCTTEGRPDARRPSQAACELKENGDV